MTDVYTDRSGSRWAQFDIDHNPLAASLHADLCHAVALAQQAVFERDAACEHLSRVHHEAETLANDLHVATTVATERGQEIDRLNAVLATMRRDRRDLDEALSGAEHRLTLVADARGHGVS